MDLAAVWSWSWKVPLGRMALQALQISTDWVRWLFEIFRPLPIKSGKMILIRCARAGAGEGKKSRFSKFKVWY